MLIHAHLHIPRHLGPVSIAPQRDVRRHVARAPVILSMQVDVLGAEAPQFNLQHIGIECHHQRPVYFASSARTASHCIVNTPPTPPILRTGLPRALPHQPESDFRWNAAAGISNHHVIRRPAQATPSSAVCAHKLPLCHRWLTIVRPHAQHQCGTRFSASPAPWAADLQSVLAYALSSMPHLVPHVLRCPCRNFQPPLQLAQRLAPPGVIPMPPLSPAHFQPLT